MFKDKNSKYTLATKNEDGFIVSEGRSYEEGFEKLSSPNLNGKLSDSVSIKKIILYIFTLILKLQEVLIQQNIFLDIKIIDLS